MAVDTNISSALPGLLFGVRKELKELFHSNIPFAFGPRMCLGRNFAALEEFKVKLFVSFSLCN